MSKHKREPEPVPTPAIAGLEPSSRVEIIEPKAARARKSLAGFFRRHRITLGVAAIVLLLGLGIMARNGWLPSTDPMTGKKTGWFGRELPKNAASSWNPLAAPLPTVTPQLSKERIYAGSRLLAVEDTNATAVPPADLAVWRPGSSAAWYVMGPGGTLAAGVGWGTTGDIPAPGDFDGDGKTDFCVFRPSNGTWYIAYSSGGTAGFAWGMAGDIPVVGDYDGDGKSDAAVWRGSDTYFYVIRSSDWSMWFQALGASGDVPASADYDGDGKTDFSVWRESDHKFRNLLSSNSYGSVQEVLFSTGTGCAVNVDCIVSADYDGDGKANFAIRNGSGWIIMNSALTSTSTTTPSGDISTDIPVQNDYDADGKCDIAVWRDSNGDWYIRKSGSGGALRQEHWGMAGDIPVPLFYRR